MGPDEKEPPQNSDVKSDDIKPNLKGDRLNVALLILLCTLQGIPVGLSVAIRTYMQNMKIPYSQQVCNYIHTYKLLFKYSTNSHVNKMK